MKYAKEEFQLGNSTVVLETGKIARQATGAVMATMDGSSVLCTVVAETSASTGRDFFPLTVDYQERMYAAGKIPGSFFRREGRPTEKETLTSRLIDRPIRPLFPKGFLNEVHVIATVMSLAKDSDPDILSMIGCSAALCVSGVPFKGPIGAARVGLSDNLYTLNPSPTELSDSSLNMVVAGTESAVLMVESEAKELSEDMMLGAVLFGHQQMQVQIQAIQSLTQAAETVAWDYSPPEPDEKLRNLVETKYGGPIKDAFQTTNKQERQAKLKDVRNNAVDELVNSEEEAVGSENPSWTDEQVVEEINGLEKRVVREKVIAGEKRIDGRAHDVVRDIKTEVSLLPNTHGSSLFQRGETQAIVAATLGTSRDSALIEDLVVNGYDSFLFHYNFPPYSVGETGRLAGPKRREIGHGRLAKRALLAVMPDQEAFPYTIRVVSEITESNGSSSMASVCGASLALMDAGVPVKAPVAGVAMGLVIEGESSAVLTDILGDEDHLGDMDFKVAGTRDGVTALQMDIKVEGITESIMERALEQAHTARLHVLDKMAESISEPRTAIAKNAPTIATMQVARDKVGAVIGKGGATIRGLEEEYGVKIELEDDGTIKIFAEDGESAEATKVSIESLVADVEIGQVYTGEIQRIENYGAFVEILPGKSGLLHISQVAEEHVEDINDHLSVGQTVEVLVRNMERGRIQLSMKQIPKTEKSRDQVPA